MSSVLRSVRKRKKGHTLGAVDVIDREEYAELEVDAKVEWIRSLVPLGLMHIEEVLDEEGTALAGERYARKAPSVGGRPAWQPPRDGRVGRPARADSRAPDSPCYGARDSTAVVRGAAWRSRSQRPVAAARAVRDLVPPLRGGRRGDSQGDRPIGVDGVPRVHSGQRDETPRAPGAGPLRGGRRGPRAGRQDVRRGDDGRRAGHHDGRGTHGSGASSRRTRRTRRG